MSSPNSTFKFKDLSKVITDIEKAGLSKLSTNNTNFTNISFSTEQNIKNKVLKINEEHKLLQRNEPTMISHVKTDLGKNIMVVKPQPFLFGEYVINKPKKNIVRTRSKKERSVSQQSSESEKRSSTQRPPEERCSKIVSNETKIDERVVVEHIVKSLLDKNRQPNIPPDVFKNLNPTYLTSTIMKFLEDGTIAVPLIRFQENYLSKINDEYSRFKQNLEKMLKKPQLITDAERLEKQEKDKKYYEKQKELNKNNPDFLKILDYEFVDVEQKPIISQFEIKNAFEELLFSCKNNHKVDIIPIGSDDILQSFFEETLGIQHLIKTHPESVKKFSSNIEDMITMKMNLDTSIFYFYMINYNKNYYNLIWAYAYQKLNAKRILHLTSEISNILAPISMQKTIDYYVTIDPETAFANSYKNIIDNFVSKENKHKILINTTQNLPIRTQTFDVISLQKDSPYIDTFWNMLDVGGVLLWFEGTKNKVLDFYKKHPNAHPGTHFSFSFFKLSHIHYRSVNISANEVMWVIVKKKTPRTKIPYNTPPLEFHPVYNTERKDKQASSSKTPYWPSQKPRVNFKIN